ncbi:hypothetical protein E3T34_01325 [Cryobacterium sp. TMT1-62]|nr:hypothetical protein E3O28_15390 [Cryobacterium sp. TMT2-14]TFD36418.1 hypothetical protein E3T34_01325 [Cryobacterium sp. TMT1-62]
MGRTPGSDEDVKVATNKEVLSSHANDRLNHHGRAVLVQRVIGKGQPVTHVAKELGISRQYSHRWITPIPHQRRRWPGRQVVRDVVMRIGAPLNSGERGGIQDMGVRLLVSLGLQGNFADRTRAG